MDVFGSRDLDSRVTPREGAAVGEWEGSGRGVHCMRDNPYHSSHVPMVGGCWGARLPGRRARWAQAWRDILADPLAWAPRYRLLCWGMAHFLK